MAPELKSAFIGTLSIGLTGSHFLGEGPAGRRRIDELNKGHFRGPRISAEIIAGMDLLLGCRDSALRPDVRLVLKLDDGEILLIQYRGYRHGPPEVMDAIARGEQVPASSYYLRTSLIFETASKKYDWMNRAVAVAVGDRSPTGVDYQVFEIL